SGTACMASAAQCASRLRYASALQCASRLRYASASALDPCGDTGHSPGGAARDPPTTASHA
ncbi:MAG TPA: hypothetical protein VIR00_10335, partial [Micromonosporaceae bacterium]